MARSWFNGFASKDCELFWSTGLLESMKSQTPSTKLQTNLKFQYQMTKTDLEFRILVIVICLIFVICDLEFLVTPADCRKGERAFNPLRGQPKAGSFGPGFFTLRGFHCKVLVTWVTGSWYTNIMLHGCISTSGWKLEPFSSPGPFPKGFP
jgi:hypothetical protein